MIILDDYDSSGPALTEISSSSATATHGSSTGTTWWMTWCVVCVAHRVGRESVHIPTWSSISRSLPSPVSCRAPFGGLLQSSLLPLLLFGGKFQEDILQCGLRYAVLGKTRVCLGSLEQSKNPCERDAILRGHTISVVEAVGSAVTRGSEEGNMYHQRERSGNKKE